MNNMNTSTADRELVESLIQPASLIHMVVPLMRSTDPHFYVQINGKALWVWRNIKGKTKMAFAVLQGSLEGLGYRQDESSSQRVGMLLVSRIYCFLKKLKKATNGKKRQKVKAETWIKMRLLPNEISHQPRDIIAEYNARAERID